MSGLSWQWQTSATNIGESAIERLRLADSHCRNAQTRQDFIPASTRRSESGRYDPCS
jgi:hypothetical protein